MSNNKNIYIGAMSGTSLDAIDVSITEIEKDVTLKSFFKTNTKLSKNENKKYNGIRFNHFN